jgi:hypothetical protein
VHLSAAGSDKTVCNFKYVLVSCVMVYQLINSDSFMGSLSKRGFKKAIFAAKYTAECLDRISHFAFRSHENETHEIATSCRALKTSFASTQTSLRYERVHEQPKAFWFQRLDQDFRSY